MNSTMIGKIEKAKRYAAEPERVRFNTLNATFHGNNDEHTISLQDGQWHCTCHFFESQDYGTCSHVMALQRLLTPMLPAAAQVHPPTEATTGAAAVAVGR